MTDKARADVVIWELQAQAAWQLSLTTETPYNAALCKGNGGIGSSKFCSVILRFRVPLLEQIPRATDWRGHRVPRVPLPKQIPPLGL